MQVRALGGSGDPPRAPPACGQARRRPPWPFTCFTAAAALPALQVAARGVAARQLVEVHARLDGAVELRHRPLGGARAKFVQLPAPPAVRHDDPFPAALRAAAGRFLGIYRFRGTVSRRLEGPTL